MQYSEIRPITTPISNSIPCHEPVLELKRLISQAKLLAPFRNVKSVKHDFDEGSVADNESISEDDEDTYNIIEEIEFNTSCLSDLRPALQRNFAYAQNARRLPACRHDCNNTAHRVTVRRACYCPGPPARLTSSSHFPPGREVTTMGFWLWHMMIDSFGYCPSNTLLEKPRSVPDV